MTTSATSGPSGSPTRGSIGSPSSEVTIGSGCRVGSGKASVKISSSSGTPAPVSALIGMAGKNVPAATAVIRSARIVSKETSSPSR